MTKKFKEAGFVIAMVISWSLYYTFSKLVVEITDSAFVTGFLLRSSAFIFLTIQLFISGTIKTILKNNRKAVFLLVLVGVLAYLLDLCADIGYEYGNLSTGSTLLKTDVLMVNITSVIIYNKKLSKFDWLGTFVMLFGVLLVLGINFKNISTNKTDILFLVSAACGTANAFIIKTLQTKYEVNTDTISYFNCGVGLVLFGASSFVSGEILNISIACIPKNLILFAILGGLAQTGIYFFYYSNLKVYEVWTVKLYLLFVPIASLVIGCIFLNETITIKKIVGILIVLLGACLILLHQNNKGKSQNPYITK